MRKKQSWRARRVHYYIINEFGKVLFAPDINGLGGAMIMWFTRRGAEGYIRLIAAGSGKPTRAYRVVRINRDGSEKILIRGQRIDSGVRLVSA